MVGFAKPLKPTLAENNNNAWTHRSPRSTRLQPHRPRSGPRRRQGPGLGPLVPVAHPAQSHESPDATPRRSGLARHRPVVLDVVGHRCRRLLVLGHLGLRAILHRLRCALRHGLQPALARNRPRHGVQDPLDERCAVPGGELHVPLRTPRVALEPCPSSHRHHRRRSGPGDRRTAPAELMDDGPQPVQPAPGLEDLQRRSPPCVRADECPGAGLHPRIRVAQGVPRCAYLGRPLCGDHRHRAVPAQLVAADAGGPAQPLWRLARLPVRSQPARGPGRRCARPPQQLPHHLHEPRVALYLHEHELPP